MSTIFSERIKELRNEKKLSQASFANLICTNQSTLSAYETGDRLPPYETLIAIAQQCHVSIDWLCGISDIKSSSPKIETYTDLIKILMLLDETQNVPSKLTLYEHHQGSFCGISIDSHNLSLNFSDKTLIEFYTEWQDILAIREKSPSGQKLYNIWLKDIYERYDYDLPPYDPDNDDNDMD